MASIKFEDRKQFENVEIEDMILKHVQAAITKPTTSNIIPPVRTSVVQSIGRNCGEISVNELELQLERMLSLKK